MPSLTTLIRSGHWPSLLGAWLHFEVSFMVWMLMGALGVSIADNLALTSTQMGLLLAMPLLSGAIWRVPVGLASDRIGAKRMGSVILLAELAGLVWGATGATSFVSLLCVSLLLGAAGASFAVALPIAGRAYPAEYQGMALGIAASANSGVVLAMFVGPRVAATVGWQATFGWMALPVLCTWALFLVAVQADPTRSSAGADSWSWATVRRDLVRDPAWRWLCGLYALTFGGFVGLSSVLPLLLHHQYGLSIIEAGSTTALCGLTGTLLRPVGGAVADRLGSLRVLPVVLATVAGLLSGLAAAPPLLLASVLAWGAIGAMGFGNGVVFRLVADRFPTRIGLASGIVGAAGAAGGMFLPLCIGGLRDVTGGYAMGLWICAVLVGATALVVGRFPLRATAPTPDSLCSLR
ncbi:MAG: MFS transporter [Nitrospiraceae bacterium]